MTQSQRRRQLGETTFGGWESPGKTRRIRSIYFGATLLFVVVFHLFSSSSSSSLSSSSSSSSSSTNNVELLDNNLAIQPPDPNPSTTTKVLLYITTLYSDTHRRYLDCCWPTLLKQSKLLKNSHVMIFSNNLTDMNTQDTDYLQSVQELFLSHGVPSLEFKFANGTPELEMLKQISIEAKLNRDMNTNLKQWGANMALSIAFSNGWFKPYDWVVRVNPDVLIRKSDFIVDYLEDDSVDAVLAICGAKINTDFIAMRPRAMKPTSFSRMYNNSALTFNHEVTAKKNFLPVLKSKRFVRVPDLDPMEGKCRVRGDHAPVYHAHDSCLKDDATMVCNALENRNVI